LRPEPLLIGVIAGPALATFVRMIVGILWCFAGAEA